MQIKKYSEEELVGMLKAHRNEAYTYLYDNYNQSLYGVVLDFIDDRNIATDILQEVFINIFRKIDTYDPSKSRLNTWMVNITRNLSIDTLRSKGHRNYRKNEDINQYTDVRTTSVSQKIDSIGVNKLLGKIKPRYQNIIYLSYYQGYTHEEIAKILDIPLGTVKTRIRSALIQLRLLV